MRVATQSSLGFLLVLGGCAHAPTAPDRSHHLSQEETGLAIPTPVLALPQVPPPQTQPGARLLLERAFQALDEGVFADAAACFHAVLATDFLTERGRANIYWFAAEAHHGLGDRTGEQDALGGFLVAADVVAPQDAELVNRAMRARAALAAMKLAAHPQFGRSPKAPIPVEDAREPASILAILSCGPTSADRYVVDREDGALGGPVVPQRATCTRDGQTIELWFDLTYARAPTVGAERR